MLIGSVLKAKGIHRGPRFVNIKGVSHGEETASVSAAFFFENFYKYWKARLNHSACGLAIKLSNGPPANEPR